MKAPLLQYPAQVLGTILAQIGIKRGLSSRHTNAAVTIKVFTSSYPLDSAVLASHR
jgi:hypothetical protein